MRGGRIRGIRAGEGRAYGESSGTRLADGEGPGLAEQIALDEVDPNLLRDGQLLLRLDPFGDDSLTGVLPQPQDHVVQEFPKLVGGNGLEDREPVQLDEFRFQVGEERKGNEAHTEVIEREFEPVRSPFLGDGEMMLDIDKSLLLRDLQDDLDIGRLLPAPDVFQEPEIYVYEHALQPMGLRCLDLLLEADFLQLEEFSDRPILPEEFLDAEFSR